MYTSSDDSRVEPGRPPTVLSVALPDVVADRFQALSARRANEPSAEENGPTGSSPWATFCRGPNSSGSVDHLHLLRFPSMPRIIVISEGSALEWVLQSQRMAFRDTARVSHVEPGEPFAIYTTRGAFHNPTTGESQIVALGRFTSEVEQTAATFGGMTYSRSCSLEITDAFEPRQGLPFRPLIDQLAFIRSKKGWATYMRRTLVRIDPKDFAIIERAFKTFVKKARVPGSKTEA